MKVKLSKIAFLLCKLAFLNAQEVSYEEYNLDNGLHVILHQDNSAPVVTTSVMYHVGAKDGMKPQKEQVLLISLNTYCLKGQKI